MFLLRFTDVYLFIIDYSKHQLRKTPIEVTSIVNVLLDLLGWD